MTTTTTTTTIDNNDDDNTFFDLIPCVQWDRIKPHIGCSLRGKAVADIGCANGYFMFRMLEVSQRLLTPFVVHPERYRNNKERLAVVLTPYSVYTCLVSL